MEIWASASRHPQHMLQHCKTFIFHFRKFYFCLVVVLVPLCYKYLFLYDFLFTHPKESIGVLEKDHLNFQKHQSIGVLKKELLQKFLHTSQHNIQGGVLFKYTRRPSWDFSKNLFNYSVENLLTPASVKRNSAAHVIRNFPEFIKHAR